MKSKCVVFDLDDTLCYEIDYLKSAYREIAALLPNDEYEKMLLKFENGENVFEYLEKNYSLNRNELLLIYRNHFPDLNLVSGAKDLFQFCKENKYYLGLISDGRSVTQRNKLKAMKIEDVFNKVIISEEVGTEKPNIRNYEFFLGTAKEYFYIGDNFKKDFVTPNKMGWTTVALLDNGKNIHSQKEFLAKEYCPKYQIRNLLEFIKILEK